MVPNLQRSGSAVLLAARRRLITESQRKCALPCQSAGLLDFVLAPKTILSGHRPESIKNAQKTRLRYCRFAQGFWPYTKHPFVPACTLVYRRTISRRWHCSAALRSSNLDRKQNGPQEPRDRSGNPVFQKTGGGNKALAARKTEKPLKTGFPDRSLAGSAYVALPIGHDLV